MDVSNQKQNNRMRILLIIVSLLFIFVLYNNINLAPVCYFYLHSHFLDRNPLHVASRTWLDELLIKLGIFQIEMISMPHHKVDKLYHHINSSCTAVYNGKLNLPCIDTEIYHNFIGRQPSLNWLFISSTMNHVCFKNLLRYIRLIEKFADPRKHIIFKSHFSNNKINGVSGWLVSRAFAKYIVDNNISFSEIFEGGFSNEAHTKLLNQIFNSTDYFDNPFMTNKICSNCDILPLEKCPPDLELFRVSDFITTGMRVFPKTMHKFSRQLKDYPSTTFLYSNDQNQFNICINTHNYKYHKLDVKEIQKNTPLIENPKISKFLIKEKRKYHPKYQNLIESNYSIYNLKPSKSTKGVIFVMSSAKAFNKAEWVASQFKQMELFTNKTFDLVFVFENLPPPENFSSAYVVTPCRPFRDGPYGLNCKNDFINRIFLDHFPGVNWVYRIIDDTFVDLDNLNRYLVKLEEFLDPSKHFVFKFLVTTFFKNIEYCTGGSGWVLSRGLIEFFIKNRISFVEFGRFSHEMQDDTTVAHIAWSLFNSSRFYNEQFIVDMTCIECEMVFREKSDRNLKECPRNIRVTKASDMIGFHSISYDPSRIYLFNNKRKLNPLLAIHYIPSDFAFHLCIARKEQLNSIDSFDFRKVTPVLSNVDTTRILRPDDYSDYYYSVRELF